MQQHPPRQHASVAARGEEPCPGWRWVSASNTDATSSVPIAVLQPESAEALDAAALPLAPALAEAGFRLLVPEPSPDENELDLERGTRGLSVPMAPTALFPCLDLIQNEQAALQQVAKALALSPPQPGAEDAVAGVTSVDLPPVLVDYVNRIGSACRILALTGDPARTFLGFVFVVNDPAAGAGGAASPGKEAAEAAAAAPAGDATRVTPCLAYRYDANRADPLQPLRGGMGLCRGLPALSLHELASAQAPFGCGLRTDAPAVAVPPSLRHAFPFAVLNDATDAWGHHAVAAYNTVVLSAPEEYFWNDPGTIEDGDVKATVLRTKAWTSKASDRLHLADVSFDCTDVKCDVVEDDGVPMHEFMHSMLDEFAAGAANEHHARNFRSRAQVLRQLAADVEPGHGTGGGAAGPHRTGPQRGYTLGQDNDEDQEESDRRRADMRVARLYIRHLCNPDGRDLPVHKILQLASAIAGRLGVIEPAGCDDLDADEPETPTCDAADFVALAIERSPDEYILWSHAGCMMSELGRHDALVIAGTAYTTQELNLRAVQLAPDRAATAMLNLGMSLKHTGQPVDIGGAPHTKLDVQLRACLMDHHSPGLAWNNFAFGLGTSRTHTVNGVEYTGWSCAQRAVRLAKANPYVWDTLAALMPAAVDAAGGLELEGFRYRRVDCAVTALLLKPDYGEAWYSLADCMPYPLAAAGADAGGDLAYDAEGRRVEAQAAAAAAVVAARVRVGAELVTQLECLQRAAKLEPCLGPAWAGLARYVREASHLGATAVRVRIGNRSYGEAECAAKAAQHALDDGEFLPMNR